MKITKRQLKKIIREEKEKFHEGQVPLANQDTIDQIEMILKDLSGQGVGNGDLIEILRQVDYIISHNWTDLGPIHNRRG